MDYEALVRRAGSGDMRAFVELTRRFQQFAFGSAVALVQDFQQAEEVVQDAERRLHDPQPQPPSTTPCR